MSMAKPTYLVTNEGEPEWLTAWRLQAYEKWCDMPTPEWAHVNFEPVDFKAISYYSAPKSLTDGPQSLDEVDPETGRFIKKVDDEKWVKAASPEGMKIRRMAYIPNKKGKIPQHVNPE